MIKSVSERNAPAAFKRKKTDKSGHNFVPDKISENPLADSFIRHSKQSLPVLLGLTAILAADAKSKNKIPLKESFKNSFLRFFIPVLVFSSFVLSNLENEETVK